MLQVFDGQELVGIDTDKRACVRLEVTPNEVFIQAPYDPALIDLLRRIPGRVYEPKQAISKVPRWQLGRVIEALRIACASEVVYVDGEGVLMGEFDAWI